MQESKDYGIRNKGNTTDGEVTEVPKLQYLYIQVIKSPNSSILYKSTQVIMYLGVALFVPSVCKTWGHKNFILASHLSFHLCHKKYVLYCLHYKCRTFYDQYGKFFPFLPGYDYEFLLARLHFSAEELLLYPRRQRPRPRPHTKC